MKTSRTRGRIIIYVIYDKVQHKIAIIKFWNESYTYAQHVGTFAFTYRSIPIFKALFIMFIFYL